jgi:hypothetical protein
LRHSYLSLALAVLKVPPIPFPQTQRLGHDATDLLIDMKTAVKLAFDFTKSNLFRKSNYKNNLSATRGQAEPLLARLIRLINFCLIVDRGSLIVAGYCRPLIVARGSFS